MYPVLHTRSSWRGMLVTDNNMRRPWYIAVLLLALVVGLGWVASVRLASEAEVQNGELVVAATVRADSVSVLAPSLAASGAAGAGVGTPPGVPSGASSSPVVAGLLTSVDTSVGAHVQAGQVIGRLDDTALQLHLDVARGAARAARARIGVVDANLDTLKHSAATLTDARARLDNTLASLRAARADIAANLARARTAVASLPPTLPPTLPPGMTDPRVVLSKLEASLAKIDAGLAQATTARAKLDASEAKLADARAQLRDARHLTVLAAEAADAGIDVAEGQVALAAVRAPYAGTVTWVTERGSVLFAGAPVARLKPDGPLLLDTYLDLAESALVRVGSRAHASIDSFPGRTFPGRVSAIRPLYEYPPTALPTRLIHLIRAFRVTVTIDDTAAPLPAGTPADLTISARS